jgi:hypothetical protein
MTPTTAFTPWTWWTPVVEADDSDETKKKKDDLQSAADCITEKGVETTSTPKYEKITTNRNLKTDAVNDKEPVTDTTTIDVKITIKSFEPEVVTESKAHNTATVNEETNQGMKEKYLKLVEHNSQLVEILRATMQVQSDLFSRIIKYMFH